MRFIKELAEWLALFFSTASAITLFAMMALTFADVFARYVVNSPVTGATELTEIMLAVVVFTAMPMMAFRNDHIVVDLTDKFFSPTMHKIRQSLIGLLFAVALFYLGSRIFVLAKRALRNGETTEYLEIPVGYVINFIGVCCWLTALLAVIYAVVNFVSASLPADRSHNGSNI